VGVRYYNPVTGRYISRDPFDYPDGLDNYLYVHNNPSNRIDPLGLVDPPNDGSTPSPGPDNSGGSGSGGSDNTAEKAPPAKKKSRHIDNLHLGSGAADRSKDITDEEYLAQQKAHAAANPGSAGGWSVREDIPGLSPGTMKTAKEANKARMNGPLAAMFVAGMAGVIAYLGGGEEGALVKGAQLAEDGIKGGEEANTVYRGLAAGEDPAKGLTARAPNADNSPLSHVAGKRESQWISTTKDMQTAVEKYGQNGVVAIDLNKVKTAIVDLTGGIPNGGRMSNWAIRDQEVLIQKTIPPEAMTPVK